jgi:hypothetical protein
MGDLFPSGARWIELADDRSDLHRHPPGQTLRDRDRRSAGSGRVAPYSPGMRRGLVQALVWLVLALVVAVVAAVIWSAVKGGGFRVPMAVALMATGALLSLSGTAVVSRTQTMDTFAFLGKGPERDEPDAGEGLTNVGFFLFVALPLLVIGLALFGRG